MRGKSSLCGIFYFFTIKKVKTLLRQEKKLSDAYGEDVLTKRQCQSWFAKFHQK
jgi:hypothetical protein